MVTSEFAELLLASWVLGGDGRCLPRDRVLAKALDTLARRATTFSKSFWANVTFAKGRTGLEWLEQDDVRAWWRDAGLIEARDDGRDEVAVSTQFLQDLLRIHRVDAFTAAMWGRALHDAVADLRDSDDG